MTDSAHYRGDMPASEYDSMDADTPDGTCSTCERKASEVVCEDCGKCRVCDCGCEAVIVDEPVADPDAFGRALGEFRLASEAVGRYASGGGSYDHGVLARQDQAAELVARMYTRAWSIAVAA